jgi:hypothetical protein
MPEPVTLELSFPYWTAYRATLQILIRSPMHIAFSAVFPVMGMALIYVWVSHNHAITLSNIVLLLACFMFTPLITAVTLYMGRRRNPLSVGPFQYLFDDSGIHASGSAFEHTIRWNAVRKIVETSEFILFYFAPTNAIAMPKPQLQAVGALDAIRAIAYANLSAIR